MVNLDDTALARPHCCTLGTIVRRRGTSQWGRVAYSLSRLTDCCSPATRETGLTRMITSQLLSTWVRRVAPCIIIPMSVCMSKRSPDAVP
jgi:hypothetical protein